jgi:hypothetical protein
MNRYLLSIYQPDGPPPAPAALEAIMQDVGSVVEQLERNDSLVLNVGLQPPAAARVLRAQDGQVLRSDGPFAESKEHIGGFLIISATDLDSATEWAGKLATATTLPVELRPLAEIG